MYLSITYESEFDDLMMHLKSKYPHKLFDLDGIGEQTDLSKFSKKFFSTSTTADVSVDANANVDDISVIAYGTELPKPFFRLNSYYMLWKELKKTFNHELANEIIERQLIGDVYINDFHGIGGGLPYCYNYSTYDIMTKGLPMVKKIKSNPPKYLYAFKSQLEQFTIIAANSTLGATGLADMLLVMSYYAKNVLNNLSDAKFKFTSIDDAWKYIKENIVSFIYTINQPMRGNQSCFTNISIYDDVFLRSLKDDYLFPDGSTLDVELVKKIQDLFLSIMNEEMDRTPVTFPITTACFAVDKEKNIIDKDFISFIAKHNQKYGFINIYCGSSSTLSSCCFVGAQKVLVKSSNGIHYLTFEELCADDNYDKYRRNMTIFHNGSWVKGNIVKSKSNDIYKITTSNNKEIIVTCDHLNPTNKGDIKTSELTTDDYLMFNCNELNSFPEKDLNLSYEQGVLIGVYLGDGNMEQKTPNHTPVIHFSLNENKYKILLPILNKAIEQMGIEQDIKLNPQYNNTFPAWISSKKLHSFIKEWTNGDYSHEKELNLNCLSQSLDFRKGILDGYYITDGGNNNRIYTTSKKIAYQLEVLITSLGKISVINVSDRTNEPVIIRGDVYKRNYPLYCIRWYDPKNKRTMKNVFKTINNSTYFKIDSIEKIQCELTDVYCFKIHNEEEPYFTLPNGIITHNCRLRSDKENEYFNSFGSGSSKIGSLGVVTINLPRLAFKYKDNTEEFYNQLTKLVNMCSKINHVKRKLVQKRIDNGNHPLYTLGFINIETQYSTVGINGFNECIEILGENILEETGIKIGLKIIQTINNENDRCAKKFKTPHNCEQIPAESVSVKLANKDKLLKIQDKYDIYSNQFIPLTTEANILDRIKLQGIFDGYFSGGAIAHINVDSRINDPKQIETLIETCAKMGVVYFAINYVISECTKGHISVTNNNTCSQCNENIMNKYTRVVGFLTNTKNWNSTRREYDFPNRQFYKGSDV